MTQQPDLIIDATGSRLGRMATHAAKAALRGQRVAIINCGSAVITGTKQRVLGKYTARREIGRPTKGPFIHRNTDRFVRRVVRSMLPYKTSRGRDAYERVMCYTGAPAGFAEKAVQYDTEPALRALSVKELCTLLGGKQ